MEVIAIKVNYRHTAANFGLAAKILLDRMELNDDGLPNNLTCLPFYYLTSHAIELYLKRKLINQGYFERNLKRIGLCHNLSNLLNEVKSNGVSIDANAERLITLLSEQHQKHDLRYSHLFREDQPVKLPRPESIILLLDKLLLLTHSEATHLSLE